MMHEDKAPNESALELRLKQTNKYVTIGLLAVFAISILMFGYLMSVKQSEQNSQDTKQALTEITLDSTTCRIYPDTDQCKLAREIAADPSKVVKPKDGADGKDGQTGPTGPAGRGVAGFDQVDGNLIVTYTDGETRNVGKVVGKDGAVGPAGPAGRGILSSELVQGSLVIHYTDATSENVGIVVGPAGKDGQNGTNGQDGTAGTPGKDGVSVIDMKIDSTNTVQVYYSDGTVRPAGQLIINTIKFMECNASTNIFTIGMTDGTSFSTTVDCTPEDGAAQPAPISSPSPTATPAPTQPTATTTVKK
jgi:hypothetical protein